MKTSEAIEKLQKIIERYGDCELGKVASTGLWIDIIVDFEFIGANRAVALTDAPDEEQTLHDKKTKKQGKKKRMAGRLRIKIQTFIYYKNHNINYTKMR